MQAKKGWVNSKYDFMGVKKSFLEHRIQKLCKRTKNKEKFPNITRFLVLT